MMAQAYQKRVLDVFAFLIQNYGMYPLRRKRFRRKQFFAAEGVAKVRVRGKNSFDEMLFGEVEHNRSHFLI
jgi:hypothetical protein